jgi:hypothetical protein
MAGHDDLDAGTAALTFIEIGLEARPLYPDSRHYQSTHMSVWCHFRTCALQQLICSNRLVGAGEERGRDSEAEDLRRFKIDDQLKINRLHDRPAFGRAHV